MAHAWGRVVFSTGPYGNRIRRLRSESPVIAVSFWHDRESNQTATICSKDNRFDNCIFEGITQLALDFMWVADVTDVYGNGPTNPGVYDVDDMQFVNCNFIGTTGSKFARRNREGSGNIVQNCIVQGFDGLYTFYDRTGYSSPPYTIGLSFKYCCFDDVSSDFDPISIDTANGNFEDDPIFLDSDYNITASSPLTSPCVDAGDPATSSSVSPKDYAGDTRPVNGTYDIGAQEAP